MTLSATGYEGEYDGNTHAASASASITEGTTISYKVGDDGEWTTEAPSIKDVGEQTVNVKAENANYETAEATVTLKVTPKAVTVTADNKSKTYGTADPELTAAVTGTLNDDTVAYTLSREKGEVVGTYAITPTGKASQGNYTVTYVPGTLAISKSGTLTLTANGYEGEYDGNSHAASASASVTEGTTISYQVGNGAWTTEAPSIKDVGEQTVNVKAENANYETASTTVTLKVTPKAVTVTAENKSKTYGETDPELTATVSGTLDNDTVRYSLSRAEGENVGEYAITPKGDKDQGNYTVTYVPGKLTISKAGAAGLNLSATGYEGEYDGKSHAASASASVTEGTTISYQVGDGEWTTEAPSIKDVGEQTVNVKAENANYETASTTVTLKVTPKAVTVTADNKSKTYGAADPELTATVSGTLDNDTVRYTLSREKGEAVGTYAITPTGKASQGNYTVSYVLGMLRITDDGVDPRLVVTKTHDGKAYQPGEEIVFRIQVTNIYDSARTIRLIEQDGVVIKGESVFKDVQPGAAVTAEAVHVVTAEDVANGSYTNHVTAHFDGSGKEFGAEDKVDSFAHLTLAKKVTSRPANGSSYALGETIRYDITAKNEGTTALEEVKIEDALTGESWTADSLAAGESRSFETSWTVTEEDIRKGHVSNVATGSAKAGDGDPVVPDPGKADEPTESPNPGLYLEKTSDKEGEVKLGETLKYTVRVLNNGNETLTDVTVTDEMTGDASKPELYLILVLAALAAAAGAGAAGRKKRRG